MFFIKIKPSIGQLMVGPIDVSRKWGVSVRYWVTYVTLIFDLTQHIHLGFLRLDFEMAVSQKL